MSYRIDVAVEPDFNPDGGGIRSFISWKRLLPHIRNKVGLKENEKIEGLVIDKDGIKVCITSD